MTTRKQHSPGFKARVAIEAIRGEKIAQPVGLAVRRCASDADRRSGGSQLCEQRRSFSWTGGSGKGQAADAGNGAPLRRDRSAEVELDWLKKDTACSTEDLQ